MAIAIGSGKLVAAYKFLQKFGLFIPYVSVISASTANMFFSRMKEVKEGIPVLEVFLKVF